LIAFHLPMHTATRLAAPVIVKVKELNASARLCAYGLYAPLNLEWLRSVGIDVFSTPVEYSVRCKYEATITNYFIAAIPDYPASVPRNQSHAATANSRFDSQEVALRFW
jgi:hypothetical protein